MRISVKYYFCSIRCNPAWQTTAWLTREVPWMCFEKPGQFWLLTLSTISGFILLVKYKSTAGPSCEKSVDSILYLQKTASRSRWQNILKSRREGCQAPLFSTECRLPLLPFYFLTGLGQTQTWWHGQVIKFKRLVAMGRCKRWKEYGKFRFLYLI